MVSGDPAFRFGSRDRRSETTFAPGPILLLGAPGSAKDPGQGDHEQPGEFPRFRPAICCAATLQRGTALGISGKGDHGPGRTGSGRSGEPDGGGAAGRARLRAGLHSGWFSADAGAGRMAGFARVARFRARASGDCDSAEGGLYSFSASSYGPTQLSNLRKYLQRLPAAAES